MLPAKQKEQSLLYKIEGFLESTLRRVDIYGHPVSLKYESSSTFKSPLGGCCTLLVVLIMVSQFLYLF